MNTSDIKRWLFKDGKDGLAGNLDSLAEDKLRALAKDLNVGFDTEASKPVVAALVKTALEAETAPQGGQQPQDGGKPPQGSATAGSKPGKAFKYRCVTRCVYNGKLVREGEVIVLGKEQKLSHFEPVKEPEGE